MRNRRVGSGIGMASLQMSSKPRRFKLLASMTIDGIADTTD